MYFKLIKTENEALASLDLKDCGKLMPNRNRKLWGSTELYNNLLCTARLMAEVRRKVYTYRHTLMVVECMAAQAKGDKERDNSIAAIVFCAFTLEGYLNHIGEELIPKWNELFESLKPKAKLMLLTDRYGMHIVFGSPPFQAFSTIFEVRNQLAHPKTKKHDYVEKKGKVWLEIGTIRWPAEKWESLCEARYAESFVDNTKEMIKLLDKTLPTEKVPDFLLSENV